MKTHRLALLVASLIAFAPSAASARPAVEAGFDDPARLARLVLERRPDYLLIDVRTPAEYVAGHIPTAINIPVDRFGNQSPTGEKDVLIIVYCRSGNRSAAARKILLDLGYTNVVDFGAVSRWEGDLVAGEDPEPLRN